MLQHYLHGRTDLGFSKAIAAHILEPRSPFETESFRRPQRWFVLSPAGSLRLGRGLRLFQFVALRTSEGDHPCRPSGTIIPQCSKAPRLSSALHSCSFAGLRGMSRVNVIT